MIDIPLVDTVWGIATAIMALDTRILIGAAAALAAAYVLREEIVEEVRERRTVLAKYGFPLTGGFVGGRQLGPDVMAAVANIIATVQSTIQSLLGVIPGI